MKTLMELVATVAPTDVTVLITGESGTGKEIIADEIYHRSKRRNKPFIKVNCAAIPGELLESELFGYEGGSFTDARKNGKIGLFELANEGTILLDEIGEMPINLQTKLLRVLQTKEITRIGGSKPIKLNIRVITSTNKNLHEEIKRGRFREDLFYRLNVVPLELKPLRERKEAISKLSEEFLNKFNKRYGKETIFQKEAIKLLEMYKWPGNIRELENLIERMVVINKDGIIKYSNIASILGTEIFDSSEYTGENELMLKEAVKNLEKGIITMALKRYGSVNKAAPRLGLSQPALSKKCKALRIAIDYDIKISSK
jgi:transcriptional regulator with PAS, ATPase and Fis domain